MFDQFKSIAKPYVQRFRKAMRNAVAFVKRNKEVTLACVGTATVAVVGVALRSATNTVQDDWVKDACDLVRNGDADFLIASNSETGASVLFAPAELVESTIAKHSGVNIKFD